MREWKIYLDGNIRQSLNLDFNENKSSHPEIWKIFEEQFKGKANVYCSDIHRAEFLRKDKGSFADRHPPEIVEKKIQQCFEKSNKIANTIVVIGNSTLGNSHLASEEEGKKLEELKEILSKAKRDDKSNPFDAHHLLTCFINDIDAFITYDKNILDNIREIKKLFDKWNKKNFIIASPKGYLRLRRVVYYSITLLSLIPLVVIFKIFTNMPYFHMFLGYGLMANIILIFNIVEKINNFDLNKERKSIITKTIDLGERLSKFYYLILAIFSGLLYILAQNAITSEVFSGIWFLLIIFAFQIPVIYFTLFLLNKKYKNSTVIEIFTISYFILSMIFGWSTANFNFYILKLSAIVDLTLATYGTLILLFLFKKYFEDYLQVY